jgi:hypothetical protein
MRVEMELAGIDTIDTINSIDGPYLTKNVKKYVKDNRLNAYILVNTWLLIVKQFSKYGWIALKESIQKNGLLAVIKDASDFADAIIRNVRIPGVFSGIYQDVTDFAHISSIYLENVEPITHDPMASILMICRYPKRYSPIGAEKLEEDSIAKFQDLEKEHRTRFYNRERSAREYEGSLNTTRSEYSQYLISRLRSTMESLMDWDSVCDEIEKIDPICLADLPTGACGDSYANVGSKLKVLTIYEPDYFQRPFNQVMIWPAEKVDRELPDDSVLVAAVPKSYKAARVIAMESVIRQMRAHQVFKILDRHSPENINLHDQNENAYLAQHGSIFNDLVTVDMSAASDSISKAFARSVFPARFMRLIEPCLGLYITYDGVNTRPMHMLSTSGNNLTFWLESMVFLCVDVEAAKLVKLFGGSCDQYIDGLAIPHIFGDDQVVHSATYETVADMMDILGLKLNREKTYFDGPFRESCGGDFYQGIPVHSYYFPRFALKGKVGKGGLSLDKGYRRDGFNKEYITSIDSLISLQRRLYFVCKDASRFIYEVLKEAFPKMTTSSPESDTFDCWGYDDTYVEVSAPAGHFMDVNVTIEYPLKGSNGHICHNYYSREMTKLKCEQKRYKKFRAGVRFSLKRKLTDYEYALYEAYKYSDFLKNGPRYEDPLLELLHISQRPPKIEEVFGAPEAFAELREIDYR